MLRRLGIGSAHGSDCLGCLISLAEGLKQPDFGRHHDGARSGEGNLRIEERAGNEICHERNALL